MRSFIALTLCSFILVLQVHSQNPLPIPAVGFNPEFVEGLWYVTNFFEQGANNSNPNPITCWTFDITINGDTAQIVSTSYYFENQTSSTSNYQITNNSAVWIDGSDTTLDIDWLYLQPFTNQFALIGSVNSQSAFYLSRSNSLSNTLVSAFTVLLKNEQYEVNSENVLTISDTCL
jgi:hypothetical protein